MQVNVGKGMEPGDVEPYRDPVDKAEADRMRVELSVAAPLQILRFPFLYFSLMFVIRL